MDGPYSNFVKSWTNFLADPKSVNYLMNPPFYSIANCGFMQIKLQDLLGVGVDTGTGSSIGMEGSAGGTGTARSRSGGSDGSDVRGSKRATSMSGYMGGPRRRLAGNRSAPVGAT